ncbi:MAG: FHA domain-containing protein [Gemmatimonadaceae bacterium]
MPPASPALPEPPAHLVDLRWGVAYPLSRVCTGIGRDQSNPILIRDLAASRAHAEVQRSGDRYVLHPIGQGETLVNGLVTSGPHTLAEGDVIEIAYTRLRFTRSAPNGDVLPAPERPALDADFAERKTEVREIMTTGRLRQLRELRHELTRPRRAHWQVVVIAVGLAALALGLVIRLVMRLL